MELTGRDYHIENTHFGPYIISHYRAQDGFLYDIILASEIVSGISSEDKNFIEIQKMRQCSEDPDVYMIKKELSFSDSDLIYEAINLNCRFYSNQMEESEKDILNFCNKYGLLLSRGYLYYKGLPYVSEDERENYDFCYKGKYDSIFLHDFIFLISRLRTLISAHAICRNKNSNDINDLSSQDPVFIFKTLLSLLIPNERICNIRPTEMISKLYELDYLSDYLYNTYYGMCWKNVGTNIDYKKYKKDSSMWALIPTHIPGNLHERIYRLLNRHSDLLPYFGLDCDFTFALKIEANEKTSDRDKKQLENIQAKLETSKPELISLVGYVAAIVLTRELYITILNQKQNQQEKLIRIGKKNFEKTFEDGSPGYI